MKYTNNKNEHGTTESYWCNKVKHTVGCNQQLSKWTCDSLNNKAILPDIENLDNYPGLVNSGILEENLQPPLC